MIVNIFNYRLIVQSLSHGEAKKINVSGRMGNVILYDSNGVQYARSMPVDVKQTDATKESAKEFGKAARIGKLLRMMETYKLNFRSISDFGQGELE